MKIALFATVQSKIIHFELFCNALLFWPDVLRTKKAIDVVAANTVNIILIILKKNLSAYHKFSY